MSLTPVTPFEPVAVETLPEGGQWIAQVKWDGVRLLSYCEGGATRLFNRRGNERTGHYPELADARQYCAASSAIFDGECIALTEGKPSFHHVMKRDGLRRLSGVSRAMELIPVTYMVFDVLYCDGRWLLDEPLEQRQRLLGHMLAPQPHVRLVDSVGDPAALLDAVREHRLEGVVCKDAASGYTLGGKDARWQKRKLQRHLTATVGGVSLRAGAVNALLLGVPDAASGALRYIGRCGSGTLGGERWRELAAELLALRAPVCPFDAPLPPAPASSDGTLWVRPTAAVCVRFMEWTDSGTMRQPVLLARDGE